MISSSVRIGLTDNLSWYRRTVTQIDTRQNTMHWLVVHWTTCMRTAKRGGRVKASLEVSRQYDAAAHWIWTSSAICKLWIRRYSHCQKASMNSRPFLDITRSELSWVLLPHKPTQVPFQVFILRIAGDLNARSLWEPRMINRKSHPCMRPT